MPTKKKSTSRPAKGRAAKSRSRMPGRAIVLAETTGSPQEVIPLLPLRGDVVFPQTVAPLIVGRPSGIRLIDDVIVRDKTVGLIAQVQPDEEDPDPAALHPVLCVGNVLKMLKFPDGSTRVVVQGVARAR